MSGRQDRTTSFHNDVWNRYHELKKDVGRFLKYLGQQFYYDTIAEEQQCKPDSIKKIINRCSKNPELLCQY